MPSYHAFIDPTLDTVFIREPATIFTSNPDLLTIAAATTSDRASEDVGETANLRNTEPEDGRIITRVRASMETFQGLLVSSFIRNLVHAPWGEGKSICIAYLLLRQYQYVTNVTAVHRILEIDPTYSAADIFNKLCTTQTWSNELRNGIYKLLGITNTHATNEDYEMQIDEYREWFIEKFGATVCRELDPVLCRNLSLLDATSKYEIAAVWSIHRLFNNSVYNALEQPEFTQVFAHELSVLYQILNSAPTTREPESPTLPRHIDFAEFPVEEATMVPVSTFEQYMKEELCKYLGVDAISTKTLRAIISNAEVSDYITARDATRCVLCGSPNKLNIMCMNCTKSFSPGTPLNATVDAQKRNLKKSFDTLDEYHRMMLSQVLDYSTRCPAKHAQPSYVGIEIELERDGDVSRKNFCKKIATEKLLGIAKSDGSLTDGLEFVTIPLPKSKAESEVTDFCKLAKENSFVAKHSCGMHVHLNRAGFDSNAHVVRFHNFFVGEDASGRDIVTDMFIKAYVGKKRYERNIGTTGRYCVKAPLRGGHLNDSGTLITSNRYAMVSLTNHETVEVRWFAATTNESKARSNIQFVIAVREYTRHEKVMSWVNFVRYAKKNITEYPDLCERLTRFRSVSNKDINLEAESSGNLQGSVL
jgi:hypothetical protein